MTALPAYPDLALVQARAQQSSSSSAVLAAYRQVPINTAGMQAWATDTAKQLAAILKQIEAEEQSAIGPLNAVIKTIRGWFSFKKEIEATRVHLRDAAFEFGQQAAAEQRRLLATAAETGAGQAEIAAAVAASVPAPQGLGSRDCWRARVVDRSKVPAEYWVLDEARLDREAKASKGTAVVPGIEFYNEPTAVLR